MGVQVKTVGAAVDDEVDQAARRDAALTSEADRAFLDGQVAQGRGGRGHDIGRAGEEKGARTALGEVGGFEVAGEGGSAGLTAADPDESFLRSGTDAEAQVAADDGSHAGDGCAVHDETAIGETEERGAVGRGDVGAGAEGEDINRACGDHLCGAEVTQGGSGGHAEVGSQRRIMEEEAVGDVVAQEIQRVGIRTGRGATDEGRSGEDAASRGLSGAGEETLIHAEFGGQIGRDQRGHAVGATGQRGSGKLGGHSGALSQLDAARIVGHGRGGERLVDHSERQCLTGSDGGRGRRADRDIVTGNAGHDSPDWDAGVGDGHTGDDSRAVADIDDVAGRCLSGADHDADGSRAHGALKGQCSIGEGDGTCAKGRASGHLREHSAAAAGDAADGEGGAGVAGVQHESAGAGFGQAKGTCQRQRLGQSIAAGDFNRAGSGEYELVTGGEGAACGKDTATETDVGRQTGDQVAGRARCDDGRIPQIDVAGDTQDASIDEPGGALVAVVHFDHGLVVAGVNEDAAAVLDDICTFTTARGQGGVELDDTLGGVDGKFAAADRAVAVGFPSGGVVEGQVTATFEG